MSVASYKMNDGQKRVEGRRRELLKQSWEKEVWTLL